MKRNGAWIVFGKVMFPRWCDHVRGRSGQNLRNEVLRSYWRGNGIRRLSLGEIGFETA